MIGAEAEAVTAGWEGDVNCGRGSGKGEREVWGEKAKEGEREKGREAKRERDVSGRRDGRKEGRETGRTEQSPFLDAREAGGDIEEVGALSVREARSREGTRESSDQSASLDTDGQQDVLGVEVRAVYDDVETLKTYLKQMAR